MKTKNESKHTPGPWAAFKKTGTSSCIFNINAGIENVATVHDGDGRNGAEMTENSTANARLIATAPELLAVTQEIVAQLENVVGDNTAPAYLDILKNARAAIAKAKGE